MGDGLRDDCIWVAGVEVPDETPFCRERARDIVNGETVATQARVLSNDHSEVSHDLQVCAEDKRIVVARYIPGVKGQTIPC